MEPKTIAREYYEEFTGENALAYIESLKDQPLKTFEGSYLDCKGGGILEPSGMAKERRRVWGKALGAFANAQGGVVIWGLEAKPDAGIDAINGLDPIQDLNKFYNDLSLDLRDATEPRMPTVEMKMIARADGKSGYIVCYIPAGKDVPYFSMREQKYFMRSGESSNVIPPNALRRMFYPERISKINCEIRNACLVDPKLAFYAIEIQLLNKGENTIEQGVVGIRTSNAALTFQDIVVSGNRGIYNLRNMLHPGMAEDWRIHLGKGKEGLPVSAVTLELYQKHFPAMDASFRFDFTTGLILTDEGATTKQLSVMMTTK